MSGGGLCVDCVSWSCVRLWRGASRHGQTGVLMSRGGNAVAPPASAGHEWPRAGGSAAQTLDKRIASVAAGLQSRRALIAELGDEVAKLERELEQLLALKHAELSAREVAFEQTRARVAAALAEQEQLIELNVGGVRFTVTRDMMQRCEESFFAQLFSGRWPDQRAADGAVFINRDAGQFHHVLAHLRGEPVVAAELTPVECAALLREADYYQLTDLCVALRPGWNDKWVLTPTPNGRLSSDGLTLTKVSSLHWDCCTSGTRGWSDGCHEWHVRLGTQGYAVTLGVGPGPAQLNQRMSSANEARRFALRCYTGKLHDTANNALDCIVGVPHGGLPDGSLVSVRLDLVAHTLTFGLNGVWNPQPSCIVPNGQWWPYFALGTEGCSMTVEH